MTTAPAAPAPYWSDGQVTLYHGDMREILPALGTVDLVLADPPYAETALAWDRWPDGWPAIAAEVTRSMWCFGSMRMFLARHGEFEAAGWRMSQDVVWEKHNGSGFASDRFKRVHEHALHWYRGDWSGVHHDTPRVPGEYDPKGRTRGRRRPDRADHAGQIAAVDYVDDGLRLARSVQYHRSVRRGLHPTEKPTSLLLPLITYACPPGGTVIDPFAGSGSTLDAARQSGRRAIGVEADERYCEAISGRLAQGALDIPA
ncbi:DNA-methyltransferase [Streptomyces xiamenensis]|uniref:DNA-methyltransferase n=1 Tax=Streptomyces xiamenensis TaxID=408015 RepID=UPI0035DC667B